MAYRRVILTGERVDDTKTNLEDFLSNKMFKTNFPGVKTKIIVSPMKKDTLVVDLNGDGADSVSKKVKDIGGKYQMTAKIKNEKTLTAVNPPVKESKTDELRKLIREEIKDVLKTIK